MTKFVLKRNTLVQLNRVLVVVALSAMWALGQEEPTPDEALDTRESTKLIGGSACSVFLPFADREANEICEQANIAAASGKWDKVLQLGNALERGVPLNGSGAWWRANANLRLADKLGSVREFSVAVERSPHVALAHWSAGISYLSIGQYRLFVKEMRWLVENSPNEPQPYYYLGRYFADELHRYEKGKEYLLEAVERDPTDYKSLYYLGYAEEFLGDWKSAAVRYENAAPRAASAPTPWSLPLQGLARLRLQEGNLPLALQYAREATSVNPMLAANHLLLGRILDAIGDEVAAIAELKTAANLDANDTTSHYVLARAYERSQRPHEREMELALFQKLKEVQRPGAFVRANYHPQAETRVELIAYLEVLMAGEPRKTVRLGSRFESDFPVSELISEIDRLIMNANASQGNVENAIDFGRKALSYNPDDVRVLLELASIMVDGSDATEPSVAMLNESESHARHALAVIPSLKPSRTMPVQEWSKSNAQMSATAHEVLGQVAFNRRRFADSAAEFALCVSQDPSPNGKQFYRLALADYFAHDQDGARTALRRALELGPESIRSRAESLLARLN